MHGRVPDRGPASIRLLAVDEEQEAGAREADDEHEVQGHDECHFDNVGAGLLPEPAWYHERFCGLHGSIPVGSHEFDLEKARRLPERAAGG